MLKKRYTDARELYWSYRPPGEEKVEKLVEHISRVYHVMDRLKREYESIVAKHVNRLATAYNTRVGPDTARRIAGSLLDFIAVYHDAGKMEVHYQLYAHKLHDSNPPPHNYSSIALIVKSDVFTKFIENILEQAPNPALSEKLFIASLTAIGMHHEYFDYQDTSFIEVLTPLTISLGKGVDPGTMLCFDRETVGQVLEHVGGEAGVVTPSSYDTEIPMSIAYEYMSTLHYELGGLHFTGQEETLSMDVEKIRPLVSLAETLTWVLALADNIAAAHGRSEGGSESSIGRLYNKYYGW